MVISYAFKYSNIRYALEVVFFTTHTHGLQLNIIFLNSCVFTCKSAAYTLPITYLMLSRVGKSFPTGHGTLVNVMALSFQYLQ